MEPLRQHGQVSPLLVLLILVGLGCAHSPVAPAPLAPEVREHLGRLGVAYQGHVFLSVDAKPLRGAGQGAGRGAIQGLALPLAVACSGGNPMGAAGAILLSPGFAAVGALVGAVLAPSAAAVEEAETVLDQVAADPDVLLAIHDRLLQAVQRRRPDAVVTLPLPEPGGVEESLAPVAWARGGIETVLEVRGPDIRFMKGRLAGSINPSLRLSVNLAARLIRTADGSVLYSFLPMYDGEARTYTGWAADNAQPLREELDRAAESLAQQIVAQVFGPDLAEFREEAPKATD